MLRWKCNKCNITWIYPVSKCSHCRGPIKKDRTSKMKVIGITKVNIPSTMHPIVPYNVLLLEDEHGNRMPKKTMKDYNIGDKYKEEKARSKNAVSIERVKYDIYEAIEQVLDLISFNVDKKLKVLIKPSIIFPAYPYQAVNTNPKIVDAIINYLLNKNIKPENITVAEQSAYGVDTIAAAKKSGILKVCQQNKVEFIDLAKSEFEEKSIEDYKFNVSKQVLNKDLIINIPVLKTHTQLGISGALENMSRIVDTETQKEMHKNNVDEQLIYLNKLINYITIGDATIGLQGNGPLLIGEPAFLNMVLASRDPVAIDRIFCEIGLFKVPNYIKLADNLGVGKSHLDDIEIVGNEIDTIKYPLIPSNNNPSPHSNVLVVDGKAWIGEYIAMYNVLARLANIKTKGISLVIGKLLEIDDVKDIDNMVAFGNNAIEHLKELGIKPILELRGDPPDLVESFTLLKKLFEGNGKIINKNKSKLAGKVASVR